MILLDSVYIGDIRCGIQKGTIMIKRSTKGKVKATKAEVGPRVPWYIRVRSDIKAYCEARAEAENRSASNVLETIVLKEMRKR